jgi:hypothetical protein
VKRLCFVIIPIAIVSFYCPLLYADSSLEYSISSAKVARVQVSENVNGTYSVAVKLREPYKKEFARVTGENIGKKLRIVFKKKILVEALIRDQIESGDIKAGEWSSQESAMKFIDTLCPRKRNIEVHQGHEKTGSGLLMCDH